MAGLTVLMDNNVLMPECPSEHGLSIYLCLENGHEWLWDTGQSGRFLQNARMLGVDLKHLSGCAFSHGHYDHTGGLDTLLAVDGTRDIPLYAHPNFICKRYVRRPNGSCEEIGIRTDDPAGVQKRLRTVREEVVLDRNLVMLTDISRLPGKYQAVDNFYLDPACLEEDIVIDDAFLILETKHGPVLILGCCHSGLANTCCFAKEKTGIKKFYALIGGTHLAAGKKAELDQAAETINTFGFSHVWPGHCTGDKGFKYLADAFPDKVHQLGAGLKIEF